ncbi:hypothetical protein WB904_004883 [Vibrio parahaemolyticus]|nr:hypothetical protein [Vibrio parahaemolyticus]EIA1769825.1 hypothetical protein [Vibrio parahaemolyticus]
MQDWVTKLPPETISNLLNCLLKQQSSVEANYKQAQAIVQIMQWFRLASFVKAYGEQGIIDNFSDYSVILCGNMLLTRTGEHRRQAYGFSFGVETSEYEASQYTAYPVSTTFGDNKVGEKARLLVNVEQSLISGGYKQTEEEIVEWSIADVF